MKVIVALDDSPYAEQIIADVCRKNWKDGAEFKILTVIDPKLSIDATNFCSDVRNILQKNISNSIIHYEIKEGNPTEEIIGAAIDWSADKIILGTCRHKSCSEYHLGSIATAVLNNSPCSIELVKLKDLNTENLSCTQAISKKTKI